MFAILVITIFFYYQAFLSENPIRVDFSLEQMYPDVDPDRELYKNFCETFSREDDIGFFTYTGDDIFSREAMENIAFIVDEISFIDGIESVASLANMDDGGLFSDDLSDFDWEKNKEFILGHHIYRDLFVSKDLGTGALIIDIENDVMDQDERQRIFKSVDAIIKKSGIDWVWHEAGIPVLRTRYIDLITYERNLFIPLAMAISAAIFFLVFRQMAGIFIPAIIICTYLIWVSGIMAMLDITINVISYLTFNLLMIIGTSNCIHLFMKYHEVLKTKTVDKKLALDIVMKDIGGALFLTSFTTAVGFLSLLFTNIRITQEFGFILGIGVFLTFILTTTMFPILLGYIRLPHHNKINRLFNSNGFFGEKTIIKWTKNNSKSVMVISGLIILVAVFGLLRINTNIAVMDDLKEGNELFDNFHFVENNFGGILPLEIVIDSKIQNGIFDPAFMNKIGVFQERVKNEVGPVTSVVSVYDHAIMLNEVLGDGSQSIPESKNELESFFLDYDGADNYLANSFSLARVSARMVNIQSSDVSLIKDKIDSIHKDVFGNAGSMYITGTTFLALKVGKHLVSSLTKSFSIAFVIIFISIIILFRSFRLALISILPNMIPLMIAGGLMGFIGIKLRPSTAITFSIALGIAIDDTIHFLARLRQEMRESGDINKAIPIAIHTTGRAILSTTAILSIGFFVLTFSEFVPNHEFGIIATIIMIVALLGAILLLPALIYTFKPTFKVNRISKGI